jgi:hypothetical protein
MRAVQRHLTYANVVATICLFVVLGGSAYAVTTLPDNAVGNRQLRANAVTAAKVKNGSLLAQDFKAGQLPRGRTGARGPAGMEGPPGPAGPAGQAGETLPAGVTLRGAFMLASDAAGTGGHADPQGKQLGEPAATQLSWGSRLPGNPTVHVIPTTGAASFECPGTAADPQASPGHVCLYQTYVSLNASLQVVQATDTADGPAAIDSRYGLGLFSNASGPGLNEITGTWAVTGW